MKKILTNILLVTVFAVVTGCANNSNEEEVPASTMQPDPIHSMPQIPDTIIAEGATFADSVVISPAPVYKPDSEAIRIKLRIAKDTHKAAISDSDRAAMKKILEYMKRKENR